MHRIFIVFVLSLIIQGCAYTSYTTKLTTPINRTCHIVSYSSVINVEENVTLSTSIGDELFVINRYEHSDMDVVTVIPPTGEKFPYSSTWVGTYKYNDGKSGDLIVYTTSNYYNEIIGVILDKHECVATSYPLVQVKERRTGRRWGLRYHGKFFTIPSKLVDSWALRYGGIKDDQYVFEIINKHDPKTTDILQTISIDKEKYISGFTIKNVLITGLKHDSNGVLVFLIEDVL